MLTRVPKALRRRLGVLVLWVIVSLSLFASLTLSRGVAARAGALGQVDVVSRFERNLEPVKAATRQFRLLGYVNDSLHGVDSLDRLQSAEYYLTQYSLAPVIVSSQPNHPYVIGCFHDSANTAKATAVLNLRVLRDFNNGFVLFANPNVRE